ncbi:GTPase HflX [Pseudorhodoplanes sp.]|uniref:GTPase HflX n=1 Tax=Pseudorhodoplanes sp. TaxID=1934341 RepID=UPI002C1288D1|nr:GTPase HflX [Pseudorhodoplanes sp.]HWV41039.1 GTPase HflX [Pseudorhodoplanes sp.]
MEPRRRDHRPERQGTDVPGRATGRALVIGPYLRTHKDGAGNATRGPQARLEEAVGLALAIDLEVVDTGIVMLNEIRPATYIGKGKVEEIAGLVKAQDIGLVVMDCALSPVQQRNLEKEWSAKVLDRTGLILEIFGKRAQTKEGVLQVELAHLTYQKSRLVRSWTHLERQRGGFGFLGGPGETQIEADRRVIEERIARIEAELEKVKKRRKLHRASRARVPYPIAALVGYTNAGKSTLFNRMTRAKVLEADMLFATLDPTLRSIELPHGTKVILSDTVGFISELPTMLVAAFRATLEEVTEADVILHVRDISHEDSEAQMQDVQDVLRALGIDEARRGRVIEVWNKIDALDADARARVENMAARVAPDNQPITVSALTGEGVDTLLTAIEDRLAETRIVIDLVLDGTDGAGLSWLHRNTEVIARATRDDGKVAVTVRADPAKAAQVRTRFAGAIALP